MAAETRDSSEPNEGDFEEDGALSRTFLLRRGFCCQLGCKNCPYRQNSGTADD
jgi:hypothetical protein